MPGSWEPLEVIEDLSLDDLCGFCRTERATIISLVEYGVLQPHGDAPDTWAFDGYCVTRAIKAQRLEKDLGINVAGIALILDLLEERASLLRRMGTGG